MYANYFVCLTKYTINFIHPIFKSEHALVNLNDIINFMAIPSIFTKDKAQTERQTNEQADRQTEDINIFQLCCTK